MEGKTDTVDNQKSQIDKVGIFIILGKIVPKLIPVFSKFIKVVPKLFGNNTGLWPPKSFEEFPN